MRRQDYKNSPEAAGLVFLDLQERLDSLNFVDDAAEAGPAYRLPRQPGLTVPLRVSLQNVDELRLEIGQHFHWEWYPVTHKKASDDFIDAVVGFVEGRYRLIEQYAGKQCYGGELEKLVEGTEDDWEQVARHRNDVIPYTRLKRTTKVRRNEAAGTGDRGKVDGDK